MSNINIITLLIKINLYKITTLYINLLILKKYVFIIKLLKKIIN